MLATLLHAGAIATVCAIPLAAPCGARTPAIANALGETRVHARQEFPTIGDGKPTGVAAGDLDGDGADELIAVTMAPPALQIWSGVPRTLRQWPEPRALPIGDFALGPVWFGPAPTRAAGANAPALIAFASRTNPGLTIVDARAAWKSPADAALVPAWHVDMKRRPRVLLSGDLGRDGKPEIGVVTIDDDLWIVRSKDDATEYALTDRQATCAAFGTDGRSVYVGFQISRRLVRYTFDAEGKKLVESGSVQLDGLPRAIDEIRRDGGDPPLLLVAGGDGSVWRYTVVEGALKALPPLDGGTIPIALAHGELRSASAAPNSPLPSGAAWIAIGLQGQEAIVRSPAAGGETILSRFYVGQHPGSAAFGDFDGDGATDVAVTNGDAKRVSVAFGLGGGRFDVAPRAQSGRGVHSLACGDMDGDGRADVVALSALDGTLGVLSNRASTSSGASGSIGVLSDAEVQGYARSGDALKLADIDGDGALDAVFVRRTDKGTVLYAFFGDGHGKLFQRAEVLPEPTGTSSGDLVIADFDGDGTLEAVASDPDGSRVAILRIERVPGPGVRFGTARSIEVKSGPRGLALVDVEGDGKPEIAAALSGPNGRMGIALLRAKKGGDGALELEEARYLPAESGVYALAIADFDGNGQGDVASLESRAENDCRIHVHYQGADRAWSGDGDGLRTGVRAYALRAGDVDGDGVPDLVATAQNNHHVNVWLNGGGKPVYFARGADLGAGTGPLDLQLVDLDGDGQLELVVANSFSNDVSTIRFH